MANGARSDDGYGGRGVPAAGPKSAAPIADRLRLLAQAAAVAAMGYEIVFRRVRASKTYQRCVFWRTRGGRTVGRLDVDFIESRKWLYVANIYVVETHGNRGVGTALLVCAARWTDCTVLTTSSRTRRGRRSSRRIGRR